MVSRIIVKPEEVRAGGDIISPAKTTTDYELYYANLTSSSETVDGVTTTVYTMTNDFGGVTLTITSTYVKSGGTVTMTAIVMDDSGNPVSGGTVKFYKET